MERKPAEPEEAICGKMLLLLHSPELGENAIACGPVINPGDMRPRSPALCELGIGQIPDRLRSLILTRVSFPFT